MNGCQASVIGHILGDGGLYNRFVGYSNTEDSLIKDFITNFKIGFKYTKKPIKVYQRKNNLKFVQIYDVKIWKKLIKLLTDKNFKKTVVHIENMLISKKQKCMFLRAMFDDEGSIQNGMITICQKDKQVIEFIKQLLVNLGFEKITSYSFEQKMFNRRYFALRLSTFESNRFKKLIGFEHKKKRNKLDTYLNKNKINFIPREKHELVCTNCKHKWLTKSTLVYTTCPNCLKKVENLLVLVNNKKKIKKPILINIIKKTAKKIKRERITEHETYDEIINRVFDKIPTGANNGNKKN